MKIRRSDALIVVDVQNDFCPGGALAVEEGNRVVPIINRLQSSFDHLVFTRDWHPPDHCSFSDDPQFVDGSWPVHCVADTPGAEFHSELHVPVEAKVVSKATHSDKEEYSAFEATDLAEHLRDKGVDRVFICGLATDVCVRQTALDAKREGFDVVVIEDACRAVDNPPGSAQKAIEEMGAASVTFCGSKDLESA